MLIRIAINNYIRGWEDEEASWIMAPIPYPRYLPNSGSVGHHPHSPTTSWIQWTSNKPSNKNVGKTGLDRARRTPKMATNAGGKEAVEDKGLETKNLANVGIMV